MDTKPIYIEDLHFEHEQWKKELLFWKDELRSFQNRLDELVQRWTNKQVLGALDHYQNQFIIHQRKMDEFLEDIHAHELNIAEPSKVKKNCIDRIYFKNHLKSRERIEIQRNIYNDMKQQFFNFLSKYM